MSIDGRLQGSCSCGRYNHIIHVPADINARNQAQVHFGTGEFNRQSHSSLLSGWLKVPLTWYRSATVSFFPDELHEHIARTFTPARRPGSQRKFCGFCGTNMSYWTEDPANEKDFMNITLGSLGSRDILALEDLDLLPVDVDLIEELKDANTAAKSNRNETTTSEHSQQVTQSAGDAVSRTSRNGISGGITWFEDMMQGSQLGYSATKRKGYGTSADGTTTISWEVSEYRDGDEDESGSKIGSKRKAGNIDPDDTAMKG